MCTAFTNFTTFRSGQTSMSVNELSQSLYYSDFLFEALYSFITITYKRPYLRIAVKNSLSHEVGKIQRVAHVGHPAKEVGDTEDPE